MKSVTYDKLSELEKSAFTEAEKALVNAYEPMLHFYVGACLISATGDLVSGTNFANTCYGSSLCAEQAAILRANTMGIKQITSLAIIARKGNEPTETITAPCGACRQMINEIAELSNHDIKVIMATTNKKQILVATISELLPLAFGSKNLVINQQAN